MAFSKQYEYFKKLNTDLIGLSVDSNSSHLAWLYDIYCKTGVRVPFPIIADLNGEVARKYGMISNDVSNTKTVRNVYMIDDKGMIRAIFVYPMEIGRNIAEILRTIHAMQLADKENVSVPANWLPNDPVIMHVPKTFSDLLKYNENNCNSKESWYLKMKQDKEIS